MLLVELEQQAIVVVRACVCVCVQGGGVGCKVYGILCM